MYFSYIVLKINSHQKLKKSQGYGREIIIVFFTRQSKFIWKALVCASLDRPTWFILFFFFETQLTWFILFISNNKNNNSVNRDIHLEVEATYQIRNSSSVYTWLVRRYDEDRRSHALGDKTIIVALRA